MRSFGLKRTTIPKVAVLATGLAFAMMVAIISPPPAQAFPNKQQDCTNCHGVGVPAGTVNAVPSTTTPAAGATYTVAVTAPANTDEPAGDTGYWIANSTAAGATGLTTGVYGGYDGSGAVTRTATMTAPAAAGTYYYKVWVVKGSTAATGVTNFKVYSITVAGAPVAVTTTTALAVTPASPVVAPASPTLKATVTGAGAAGTVEFFNGTTSLGAATAISGGVASKTLANVAAGSYSYTAKFVPTSAAAFTPSTSSVSTYVVTVPAPVVVTTTTALAVTPASPVVAPASPTLKATVTGTGAAGTVEFFNGTTSLGAATAISGGVASKALINVAAGSYSYKAVFTPTDAAAFTASTSSVSAYVVTVAPPVVVTTTTALAVSPASPVVAPASPTLTATVSGAGAAGTVEFFAGTNSLGTPTAISAGVATKALVGVVAGSYSYKAVFTPTDAAAFTSSTSLVSTYVVTVAPPVVVTTTTALAVTPASPVDAPASPTLTATVSGAGAAGIVEFFNGAISLGTSPVASGIAVKTLSGVVAGSYSYTAVFTPADAAAFTPSTSSVTAYVVTEVPVVTGPVITTLSPNHGLAGATVTINGSGFGTAGVVTFGAAAVTPTSWTDTAITFVVPAGSRSALVSVTPTDDVASNLVKFRFERVKVPRV